MEFDFEQDVEKVLPRPEEDTITSEITNFKVSDHKRRKVVCRHWLLGLCHNGSLLVLITPKDFSYSFYNMLIGMHCDYLHRLDKAKMPPCKHAKMCKIKNCPLKHMADEELEECMFFKQGFCYNGPKCGRRHVKRTPEECPAEAVFENITVLQATTGKKLKTGQPNDNYKVKTLLFNTIICMI